MATTSAQAQEAKVYLDQGSTAIKLRLGQGLEPDIEKVKAVREAVGSKMDIVVDFNKWYTPDLAVKLIRKLEEYDIMMVEEPIPPDNPKATARIAQGVHTPIAVSESLNTRWDFRAFLEDGAVDVIQPDTAVTGGILEA